MEDLFKSASFSADAGREDDTAYIEPFSGENDIRRRLTRSHMSAT